MYLMAEDGQCDRSILDVLTGVIKYVVVDGSIYVEFNDAPQRNEFYNNNNNNNNINLLLASVLEHVGRLTLRVVN
jgi:hypothetical protein